MTTDPTLLDELRLVSAAEDDIRAVRVPDVRSAHELLRRRISEHPQAAEVLDQVLRLTSRLDVAHGLIAESLAYSMLLGGQEFARWRLSRPRRDIPASTDPAVLVVRDGDELTLTLNRPDRRNAYSREVRDALLEALTVAEADPDVRVHLRGAGPSFSSGGDLDEFGTATDLVQAHLIRLEQSAGRVLHGLSERTTAHLHGHCIGAGIEIPAFAGRAIAHECATFQLPELSLGLVPGAGGTISVVRRIGPWRTLWMVLSGVAIDASTALRWGLVDEITRSTASDP